MARTFPVRAIAFLKSQERSMRVGEFELNILGKHHTSEAYVRMRHGEQYSLEIGNHSGDTVNLYVKIDGLSVGDFQIGPHKTAVLERPIGTQQRFTFFASGTSEAGTVGEAGIGRADKGLVSVEFVPPKPQPVTTLRTSGRVSLSDEGSFGPVITKSLGPVMRSASEPYSQSATRGFGAGVTGMTGHSDQTFGFGRYIDEDRSRAVTITLRLVHDETIARVDPQPLPGRVRGNPVPGPVA
jgi:hypothetical protein